MSFVNKCSTIIRRSSKDMLNFYCKENLVYDYFDSDENFISSIKITDFPIDFTNYYFTLDEDDSVYGIYKDKSLKLFEIFKDSYTFSQRDILTYNHKKFDVTFPYIKRFKDSIHILYYVHYNGSNNTCALFHHYYHNGVWSENKVDFINNIVLNNYVVLWVQDNPFVFYLNLVDEYEEVFMCRFNYSTSTWSSPIQLTNSKKNKIYLSVIKDNMNFYHISFCENIDTGYAVKYINGYLSEDSLDINISKYITGPSTCMYPTLMKNNSNLYIMWVNYGKLNTVLSTDIGKTWNENEIDEFSIDEYFTKANFFSNFKDDLPYNLTSIFTIENQINLLGF